MPRSRCRISQIVREFFSRNLSKYVSGGIAVASMYVYCGALDGYKREMAQVAYNLEADLRLSLGDIFSAASPDEEMLRRPGRHLAYLVTTGELIRCKTDSCLGL